MRYKIWKNKEIEFLKTQRNKCIYNQIFHHVMFSSATSLLLAQNFKQLKVLCTFVQILKYIKKKNLEAKKLLFHVPCILICSKYTFTDILINANLENILILLNIEHSNSMKS